MKPWFFIFVQRSRYRLKVNVLKQLTTVATKSFDMLVVCLLQSSLKTSIHCPVSMNLKKKSRAVLLRILYWRFSRNIHIRFLFTWTKLIACRPFLRVAIHLSNASSERLLKCTKNILRYKYAMIEIQKIYIPVR